MNIAIILAGGQGKRMNSSKPKALLEVLGEPMLGWVISTCVEVGLSNITITKGYAEEQLQEYIDTHHADLNIRTVMQKERLGTGHAVMCAKEILKAEKPDNVIVLYGDTPLIDAKTIGEALQVHISENNAVTVITADVDNPYGYGRIIRNDSGISAIVEQRDLVGNQSDIKEINSGCYWFKTDELLSALDEIKPNNAQGEYYLTDTIGVLVANGKRAGAYKAANANVVLGANDRVGLLRLSDIARKYIIEKHAEQGVEFISTEGIVISPKAKIEAGAKILPGSQISEGSYIACGTVIGPNTRIIHSSIGENSVVDSSVIEHSAIGKGCNIGPFTHLRPNTVMRDYSHAGNFVEIKNSEVGCGTSISHLTYIGDSNIGNNVNFGCGVAVANYNGNEKNRCIVKDNAFIGCHTNLVSPVVVGEAAYTGAGSTVTKDIPDGALAVERGELRVLNGEGIKRLKRHLEKGKSLESKLKNNTEK